MSENEKEAINEQRSDQDLSAGETADIDRQMSEITTAVGRITVAWQKDKQMNDIWRAFDQIRDAVFNKSNWNIDEEEAKELVKKRAKESYVSSKARYYAKQSGAISFYGNGSLK